METFFSKNLLLKKLFALTNIHKVFVDETDYAEVNILSKIMIGAPHLEMNHIFSYLTQLNQILTEVPLTICNLTGDSEAQWGVTSMVK